MNIIVNATLYKILKKFEREQLLKNKINTRRNKIGENYLFKKYKKIQKQRQKVIDDNLLKFYNVGRSSC